MVTAAGARRGWELLLQLGDAPFRADDALVVAGGQVAADLQRVSEEEEIPVASLPHVPLPPAFVLIVANHGRHRLATPGTHQRFDLGSTCPVIPTRGDVIPGRLKLVSGRHDLHRRVVSMVRSQWLLCSCCTTQVSERTSFSSGKFVNGRDQPRSCCSRATVSGGAASPATAAAAAAAERLRALVAATITGLPRPPSG